MQEFSWPGRSRVGTVPRGMRHAGIPGCARGLAQCSRRRRCRARSNARVPTVDLPDCATARGSGRGWFESASGPGWIMGGPPAVANSGNCVGHRPAKADRRGHCRVKRIRPALTKGDGSPEKSRLVLLLTSIDGHWLEVVAELLRLPVGTVKTRLHSARKQLAEKLRWPATNARMRCCKRQQAAALGMGTLWVSAAENPRLSTRHRSPSDGNDTVEDIGHVYGV